MTCASSIFQCYHDLRAAHTHKSVLRNTALMGPDTSLEVTKKEKNHVNAKHKAHSAPGIQFQIWNHRTVSDSSLARMIPWSHERDFTVWTPLLWMATNRLQMCQHKRFYDAAVRDVHASTKYCISISFLYRMTWCKHLLFFRTWGSICAKKIL